MTRNVILAVALSLSGGGAWAQTEISCLRALNDIATTFNASQSEHRITPVFEKGHAETLAAAMAAFRAGERPSLVQAFDAALATTGAAPKGVPPPLSSAPRKCASSTT